MYNSHRILNEPLPNTRMPCKQTFWQPTVPFVA